MSLIAEPIATERLLLGPLRTDHAAPMAAVLADPRLYHRIGGAPPTPAELRRRYTAMLAGPGEPGHARLNRIIGDPEPAGTVQATVTPGDSGPSAALAWIAGTGRQAADGVRCITAAIAPGHRASEGVARSCGTAPTAERQAGERIRRSAAPACAPPR
ncbi:GNAT family N-acetyltransferase [Nocardiopsis halophila]|uniref:GNAT family N-acetyltransferase n=1 Tax=Nocardiopsis halophila TaxID=141692 RepID=UPI00034C5F71|nr:GNAT family N-acetyltransferase [Nocardiopsis halophila]